MDSVEMVFQTKRIKGKIMTLKTGINVTITLDTADYYAIINCMRDLCNCGECQRITNDMMMQHRAARMGDMNDK